MHPDHQTVLAGACHARYDTAGINYAWYLTDRYAIVYTSRNVRLERINSKAIFCQYRTDMEAILARLGYEQKIIDNFKREGVSCNCIYHKI